MRWTYPSCSTSLEKGGNVIAALDEKIRRNHSRATMHEAWVNFITTGSPQHPDLPEWPVYEPSRRATMQFDAESQVVDDPDGDERRLWHGVQF